MLSNKIPTFVGTTVLVVLFVFSIFSSQGNTADVTSDPKNLPGIQTGSSPWPREFEHLLLRLRAIGLPALREEGQVLHTHQHIDIFINGAPVPVPARIGINEFAGFISIIHTHDDSGIIHIESPESREFNLGQFFDIWGVRFTKDCIGGHCAKGATTLKVFSNGKPVSGDPRLLALQQRQEIAVVYGPPNSVKSVPSKYDKFEPGM